MVAFPIPAPDGVSPLVAVIFGLVAVVAFVAIVFQAVRYFRNSGDRHDQFGPPSDRDDKKDDQP